MLAGLVAILTDEQLAAASGAAEWTVAQVLSHLGSGTEIGRAPNARTAGDTVAVEDNQEIWARWDAAPVLVDLLAGPLGFLLGFLAKPAERTDPVLVAVPGAGLVIDDAVTVVDHLESPTATFDGPAAAFVRLTSGQLKAPYIRSVTVEGGVTLDDLRRVFPGF